MVKAQPGKFTFSSAGTGNGSHLAQTVFLHAAGGLDMIHVPYKGGAPAIQALIAGEVQMTAVSVNTSLPHIKSGRARALVERCAHGRNPFLATLRSLSVGRRERRADLGNEFVTGLKHKWLKPRP